jgi:hypothetical protein
MKTNSQTIPLYIFKIRMDFHCSLGFHFFRMVESPMLSAAQVKLVSNGRLSEHQTKAYKGLRSAVLVPGLLCRDRGEH